MTLFFHLFLIVLISQKSSIFINFFFNLTQLSFIFQDSSCVFCIPSTISLHMTSEPPPPPEFKCNQQFCMFFTAESMNEYSVALIMVYCSLLHSPNFVNAKGSCRIENQRQ